MQLQGSVHHPTTAQPDVPRDIPYIIIDVLQVSISLVLDRSSSMQGPNMSLVKSTCDFLLQQLSSDDIVSCVSYDEKMRALSSFVSGAEHSVARRVSGTSRSLNVLTLHSDVLVFLPRRCGSGGPSSSLCHSLAACAAVSTETSSGRGAVTALYHTSFKLLRLLDAWQLCCVQVASVHPPVKCTPVNVQQVSTAINSIETV
jgi:hypothetical protein